MSPEKRPFQLLVVDNETSSRKLMADTLKKEGYGVTTAATCEKARELIRREKFDLVLAGLTPDNQTGLEVAQCLRTNSPGTEFIVVTSEGSAFSVGELIQAGAADYLTKPLVSEHLRLRVKKALELRRMKEELTTLRQHVAMSYGFDNIIGVSRVMKKLKATARRVAATDITVLITGPSGTGKELFARAIHHHFNRRDRRFVAIDCGAIPEQLLESELFGHTKGSFTSAHQSRTGLLAAADGGTVFLDELNNMPMPVQAKLLRFLQDSVIRPVGTSKTHKVDVRIIGATNKDLAEMVSANRFREDLYYRLNVIPLYLPPLSERPEDIEVLTEYFLRKIATELERPAFTISREAVAKLRRYHWPGNVRELENTLKRAVALSRETVLDADSIVFVGPLVRPEEPTNKEATVEEGTHRLSLKVGRLDDTQRTLILKALDQNDWNFTRTAAQLGIGRTTLWRKIKKYNLSRETAGEVTA
ncbi:MAG: sigma-54-dependent Fis family transcriptional regulator [Candidatus Zixiibacteriota bacterium]|nr:MAG: sigma-54-dependent Fis family transcriptional regulator [candidate division Zixibacteria bacterium]